MIMESIATQQKRIGRSNPYFWVKMTATQVTHFMGNINHLANKSKQAVSLQVTMTD